MMFQTVIGAFALAIAIGGFGLWFWIDAAILPKRPSCYVRYSLAGGILFSAACFAAFIALVIPQSGQSLLVFGLIGSFLMGFIVGIGMASPYWITKKLQGRHRTDITRGDNHV